MRPPKQEGRKVLYYIFRPYYKHSVTGELIWARDHGYKAWTPRAQ